MAHLIVFLSSLSRSLKLMVQNGFWYYSKAVFLWVSAYLGGKRRAMKRERTREREDIYIRKKLRNERFIAENVEKATNITNEIHSPPIEMCYSHYILSNDRRRERKSRTKKTSRVWHFNHWSTSVFIASFFRFQLRNRFVFRAERKARETKKQKWDIERFLFFIEPMMRRARWLVNEFVLCLEQSERSSTNVLLESCILCVYVCLYWR